MNEATLDWITCPRCEAEGEVDMEWIGERFVADSGHSCPLCRGDMGFGDMDELEQARAKATDEVISEFQKRARAAQGLAEEGESAGLPADHEHVVSAQASSACWKAAAEYLERQHP